MSSSQHRASRCVFVGNIPYDATEEQLVQICEEVGPVVSFRLVVDRETGKPKGYGFCEFRDEETALSARRNLQGYEINGRQLRVDFAENEKGGGVDRSREQGRGGPGLQQQSYNYDAQKQPGSVLTHSGLHTSDNTQLDQPIGYQAATAAASVMAGALGNSQLAMLLSQAQGTGHMNGPAQTNGNTDSLTSHLASMSKQQLYEIMMQMKALMQQNQLQARQLLVGNPQLTKALFQAQIMLGMVKPSQVGVAQQAQPQTSLAQQTTSVISQQVAPQLQAPSRQTAGVPAQNIQQPLFQPVSSQVQQSMSQMQFQVSLPQSQLAMAYQQHGQQLSSQSVSQQSYQQMVPSILATTASRGGGEMSGGAMLGQGGVSGGGGMLGGNIGMGAQVGRGGMASGMMHHPSQASGNLSTLGGLAHGGQMGSHLLGGGSLAGGMGMSMGGGPMGSDVNPRIAYGAASDVVHAGNGYGQVQLHQLQAQQQRQAQSQAQAQPQLQVQMELEQQKALLQQVLQLTPDQINLLPMEQRQQVLQLQQALR